jgi:hypothetical protein
MSDANAKYNALHVATMSGWYRFERNEREWKQVKRDLSYWTLTCLAVDPDNPGLIYAGTEHSGLFYSKDAGAHWLRADPNVPKMMLFSALALNGGVMVGTVPSAVFRSKAGGGWEELDGVRINSANANFPPSPELQSRARYLASDPLNPARLYAGIEVGGMLLSDDGGRHWHAANNGLTDMDVHEVHACEKSPGMVYAAGLFAAVTAPHTGKKSHPRAMTTACRSSKTLKGSSTWAAPRDDPTHGSENKAPMPPFFAQPTLDHTGKPLSKICTAGSWACVRVPTETASSPDYRTEPFTPSTIRGHGWSPAECPASWQ